MTHFRARLILSFDIYSYLLRYSYDIYQFSYSYSSWVVAESLALTSIFGLLSLPSDSLDWLSYFSIWDFTIDFSLSLSIIESVPLEFLSLLDRLDFYITFSSLW